MCFACCVRLSGVRVVQAPSATARHLPHVRLQAIITTLGQHCALPLLCLYLLCAACGALGAASLQCEGARDCAGSSL
jgi:hypothetical protein